MRRAFRRGAAMLLAAALAACVPPDLDDLTLIEMRQPTADERLHLRLHPWFGESDVELVAVLASGTDIRRHAARMDSNLSTVLVRCDGRTDIADTYPLGPLIDHAELWDNQGRVTQGTRSDSTAGTRRSPYLYWLPIRRVTRARQSYHGANRQVDFWRADHDLRRDAADLCLFVRAGIMLLGAWRTNTVVIPQSAVRAALAERAR